MSGTTATTAMDEVLQIADGLPREVIAQRARQSFNLANEVRMSYGAFSVEKRVPALFRALNWADVLRHMDSADEAVFCGSLASHSSRTTLSSRWHQLTELFWWTDLLALTEAFRHIFGTKPIEFYAWPEDEVEGAS
jgi:hypothetical protein